MKREFEFTRRIALNKPPKREKNDNNNDNAVAVLAAALGVVALFAFVTILIALS